CEELHDTRDDFGTETRAVEHAIMADPALQIMGLLVSGNAGAERVCGFGLAHTRNVVALALDGHERGALDRTGIDALAAMHEAPARQIVIDEHPLDRLKIELG